jgi:hypothetical protein
MNKKTLKFMVDMLNLIFGKSKETDYFWDQYLIPETTKYFKFAEAMKYHQYQEGMETLISRNNVNLNSMFYAFMHLFGLKINLNKGASTTPQN